LYKKIVLNFLLFKLFTFVFINLNNTFLFFFNNIHRGRLHKKIITQRCKEIIVLITKIMNIKEIGMLLRDKVLVKCRINKFKISFYLCHFKKKGAKSSKLLKLQRKRKIS